MMLRGKSFPIVRHLNLARLSDKRNCNMNVLKSSHSLFQRPLSVFQSSQEALKAPLSKAVDGRNNSPRSNIFRNIMASRIKRGNNAYLTSIRAFSNVR